MPSQSLKEAKILIDISLRDIENKWAKGEAFHMIGKLLGSLVQAVDRILTHLEQQEKADNDIS